jgi:hypothetical protein
MLKYARCSPCNLVVGLIYLQRLMDSDRDGKQTLLSSYNIQRLLLTALYAGIQFGVGDVVAVEVLSERLVRRIRRPQAYKQRRGTYFYYNRAAIGIACAQATAMRIDIERERKEEREREREREVLLTITK